MKTEKSQVLFYRVQVEFEGARSFSHDQGNPNPFFFSPFLIVIPRSPFSFLCFLFLFLFLSPLLFLEEGKTPPGKKRAKSHKGERKEKEKKKRRDGKKV